MARKFKKFNNPFLKIKEGILDPIVSALPDIKSAIALHKKGQIGQAQTIYKQILEVDPKNADALHLLGVIARQTGHHQVALDMIGLAIEIDPTVAIYFSNQGNVLLELKQFDAAIASYDKAITLKPDFAEAYYSRGNVLLENKQFNEAIDSYDNAIELKPDYAEAYSNRGNSLQELRQFDAAIDSYDRAISINNNFAQAYSNKGLLLQELNQIQDALAIFDKAIELNPTYAGAYSNRGNALRELKQLDAAVASCDKAIALKPDFAEAYSNRGNALKELRQLDAAFRSYKKAVILKPEYAIAHFNLAIALQELKQFDAAIASFDKAIALKPDFDYLFGIRQHTKMIACDWQDFEANVLELNCKIQGKLKATSCFAALTLPIDLAAQRQVAETLIKDKYPFNSALAPIPKAVRQAKIRIGYYSADFHNHATAYLMAELFELHEKGEFEILAFSFGPNTNDEMRNRLNQAFDQFIDVSAMSDMDVAKKSRELCIDIAVDLKGLTQDARLGIFSYKAAPIQVSYLGYPGTLGTNYIDYLIADETVIPKESLQYYSEKITYLPNSYQVNDRQRTIATTLINKKELGLPQDAFVFCCFSNNFKITPDLFDIWTRILKAVDASVLWLLEDNQVAASNLRKEAVLRGIEPARLIFAKRMNLPDHLARHKAADLFLDTLHYNAHTTASDALWAGLPVLTCMGGSFASRVAGSLLYAIGLPELITSAKSEYEFLAIELAKNPVKLKAIKDKLERNRLTTPLFDTPLFTKHLEAAYIKMYDRYQADLLPEHIFISDTNS